MSALQLCEQLLSAPSASRRIQLLNEATADPECTQILLEKARTALMTLPSEALAAAELASEITQRRSDSRSGAAVWRIRAQALRALGQHTDALSAFESAAECAQQVGDIRLAAQVQIGRIDSLSILGRFDEAVALARRLEEELHAAGAEEDAAKVLVNAGNLYWRRDQYAPALDCYQRALAIFAGYGNALVQARVQTNCANILTHLDRIEEAIHLYEQARAVFAANEMVPEAAVVDNNVGYLHYVSGKHATALAAFYRARGAFDTRGQDLEAAKCDADMAAVYHALNLYPEALECYERAIRVFERIDVYYECARAELGRAAVLQAVGRLAEAFAGLERADAIFDAQKNTLQRAHVHLARAYLLRSVGRSTEACDEARLAARALTRQGLYGWAAEARFILADTELEEGRDAIRRMQAIGRAAKRHARGWLEARAENALGHYFLRRAEGKRALPHFRAAVVALEQARTLIAPEEMHVAFLRDKLAIYERVIATLLARGKAQDVAEALEYVERSKSRLLLERVQSALSARPPAPGTSLAPAHTKLAALRAELSRAYHRAQAFDAGDRQRLAGAGSADMEEVASLEQTYRAALQEVELTDLGSVPGVAALASIITADALRMALGPDEMLVEFYVINGEVCAFVVAAQKVRAQIGMARLDTVVHASRRLRCHLQKAAILGGYAQRNAQQLNTAIQQVLHHLYELLLKPLEALLTTEKVVLIPHGILHGLPFHAFFDGERHALDRWEFVYAPSAAVWHLGVRRSQTEATRPERADKSKSVLLMGIPGPGIERVAAEVEELARLLPGARVFCGETATQEAFRTYAGRSRLIHLATHALFRADNPLFSGLQFADGWLLARDLYEMRLDCELATLSACRTGMAFVEPGDELFGLIRGFLSAGVRSLAVSLWPADDVATETMMRHFYQGLACGMSRAAALRAAQRETRNGYAHPYHWAAFALVGER